MAIWDPLESLYQAHPINTDPTYYTCFCYVVGGAMTAPWGVPISLLHRVCPSITPLLTSW
jgi:hypothetical protein